MRYISVCSGIEAASVAWQPLGWEAVAFAEIEPFPSAVLKYHYPDVPNLGDISKVNWSKYAGTVDVLVGGTPCQSFSIAGKREGMDGASGLVREYFRLLSECKPRWFVWENVPGAFSSNGGDDWLFILREWHERGYHVSYRVLDAQYAGVPQRRRRVFAVGFLGDWRPPAKVLFEQYSLQRHPAPSRKKGKADSGAVEGGVEPSGYRLTAFGEYADDDSASTLKQRDYKDATDLICSPIAFKVRQGKEGGGKGYLGSEDQAFTLAATQDQQIFNKMAVRRLTPLEAERLQGFPDGYTDIPFKGKPAPDGARYKALGNSMAVPCMAWIGKRIQAVEDGTI